MQRPADLFKAWCLEQTGGSETLAREWSLELEAILSQAIQQHRETRAALPKPEKTEAESQSVIIHDPLWCDPSVPEWLRYLWGCPS